MLRLFPVDLTGLGTSPGQPAGGREAPHCHRPAGACYPPPAHPSRAASGPQVREQAPLRGAKAGPNQPPAYGRMSHRGGPCSEATELRAVSVQLQVTIRPPLSFVLFITSRCLRCHPDSHGMSHGSVCGPSSRHPAELPKPRQCDRASVRAGHPSPCTI